MPEGAVAVIGAGSWGTTVAAMLATRRATCLWARSTEVADDVNRNHRNSRYLGDLVLPDALRATTSLPDALADTPLVLVAVPSHGFRRVLEGMAGVVPAGVPVVSLAKGIEEGTRRRMSEIVAELLPDNPAGALSGPNLSHEVAAGHPAATVVALPEQGMAERVQDLLHSSTFRVYTGTDVVGCEIAGATKNVMAIAAGIGDGLGLGDNTRAVLITRGLAELGRLGVALGGKVLTFGGLAGVGDLVATCASPQSRNRTVGYALGEGRSLQEIVGGMHMVAEGVKSAGPLVGLARSQGVEMPIAEQVHAIIEGRCSPADALMNLMARPSRPEWDEALLRSLPR
jgi:glycerol-3-phosphate dehydrogenase (NAD(P)+)